MSFAAVDVASHGHFSHTMVDSMVRPPLDTWAHEPYAPRHAAYYSQQQQDHVLRLPPPSSLVFEEPPGRGAPKNHERIGHSQLLYRDTNGTIRSPTRRTSPLDSANVDPHPRQNSFRGRHSNVESPHSGVHSSVGISPPSKFTDYSRLRSVLGDRTSHEASGLHFQSLRIRKSLHVDTQSGIAQSGLPPLDYKPHDLRLELSPQASNPTQQKRQSQLDVRAPERMRISDLLSDEPKSRDPVISSPSSKAPALAANTTAAAAASTYRVQVRQQPWAARACGYGERDRRVIDPPPIVQVSIEDPSASESDIQAWLHHPFSVMHCTIWNDKGDQDCSAMPEDYRQQRRLMGTIVSSPFIGNDDKDVEGCFFCFPDLSCRTPGSYRLKFSLVVLDPKSHPGNKTPVSAVVMSDVFTVYNAKDFPGMQASTSLTKRLKEQGCLISIKKGNEKKSTRFDDSENDEEDEEERRPKRSKRL